MTQLLYRVVMASAAVSAVLLPLLLVSRWQKRYAPHTRRAVWLVIAAVLLAAPMLPKARAPVQITVPERLEAVPAAAAPTVVRQAADFPGPAMTGTPDPDREEAEPSAPGTEPARVLEWGGILALLWLAGGAAVLLWQGARYLFTYRRLRKDAVLMAGYEKLTGELCPHRTVRFFRVSGLNTPMTMGTLRPVVLLPDGDVCQAAVRHELVHIRRWDVAWKYLLLLACAVHWFNPLVWLMSHRAERDMEASCDAAVLAGGDAAERRAYGELLIRTAAGQGIPFTTQFGGGKKLMKARLYDLFHPGKRSRGLVGAVLLLCLAAGSLVAFRSAVPMTAEEAARALEESISYESGALSFTIPADYSPAEDWSIHIAGRAEADGLSGISLHYLDGEQWVAGKTYTLDIAEEQWPNITELSMEVSLGGESRAIDLLALVDLALTASEADGNWELHQVVLPSGLLEKNSYNAEIFEITPFAVNLYLPAGWTVREAASMRQEGEETYPVVAGLFSVQCILDETGRPVGSLGYNLAPVYEEKTDDPMALFAGITMAKHGFDVADTFVPVTEGGGLLVAMTDVVQDHSPNEGGEAVYDRGILLRDERFGVYVAIELDSGALTEQQTLDIAVRLSLSAVSAAETEYMLQDGLVYILQADGVTWEPWSDPVPAPASWAAQDLAGRDQAETLVDCEHWIGMTSAENGWLVASVGAGVAHADTYVYRTHDGGRTWQETGRPEEALWYPSCVAFLDDQRAVIGIGVFARTQIYMTEDGGETWSELELPLPEDGLVYEADHIVFYGTCGVITLHSGDTHTAVTTEDHGKTWKITSPRFEFAEDGGPAYLPFVPELLPTEQFDDRLHDNDPIRLLGELPEEGIRLYGLTWASVGIGGTLLTVEQDGEPVILHYNIEIAPRSMEVYDYDRDGIEELVVEAASADGETAVFLFALEGADFGQMRQVR